jgi:hypothetical protein
LEPALNIIFSLPGLLLREIACSVDDCVSLAMSQRPSPNVSDSAALRLQASQSSHHAKVGWCMAELQKTTWSDPNNSELKSDFNTRAGGRRASDDYKEQWV